MDEHARSPYTVLSLGSSADGERYLEVRILNHRRRERRLISMRDLQSSPDNAIRYLGIPLLTRSAKNEFLADAERAFQTMRPTFHVATKPGLIRGVFILPDGTCVPGTNDLEVCLPQEFWVY